MRRLRLSYKKNTKTTVFSQPQRNHIDAHLYLLPGEKTPSAVRRMRRRNRNRRNPPHPAGFAVHTSLLLEEKVPSAVRRMRWHYDFRPIAV